MLIKVAATLILIADLESAGRPLPVLPAAPGRAAQVYVAPTVPEPVTVGVFQETYVTVTGLDGKLMVAQEVLDELGLRSGQEVDQLTMYRILEHNRKLY